LDGGAEGLFVGLVWNEGLPCVTYGLWESEGSGFGELTGARASGEYEASLSFGFPALEADVLHDAIPETTVSILIDMSGLDRDGKINIKIENHGGGEWHTYAYGGASSDEAYARYRENK
jgi:hypothetical protein